MTTHTPEPWRVDGHYGIVRDTPGACPRVIVDSTISGESDMPSTTDAANAARIVACVNACRGIADPENAIPDMQNCLRELLAWGREQTRHCCAEDAAELTKQLSVFASLMPEYGVELQNESSP